MHACMHAYINTCIHTYIHTYLPTYMYPVFAASDVVCTLGTGWSNGFICRDMRRFFDLQGLQFQFDPCMTVLAKKINHNLMFCRPLDETENPHTGSALKENFLSSESKATWRVESSRLHGQKFHKLPIYRCIFSLRFSDAAFRNPVSQ